MDAKSLIEEEGLHGPITATPDKALVYHGVDDDFSPDGGMKSPTTESRHAE